MVLRALRACLLSTFSETGLVECRGELSNDDSCILGILGVEPAGSGEGMSLRKERKRDIESALLSKRLGHFVK